MQKLITFFLDSSLTIELNQKTNLLYGYLAGHVVIFADLATLRLEHDLKQALHGPDVEAEELELALEHAEDVIEHLVELGLALGDQVAALLDVLSDRRQHQFRVDRAVPLHQGQTHRGRHQLAPRVHHMHILSLYNVVYMGRDRGIGAYSVLFHLRNELGFSQETWGRCLYRRLR